MRERERARGREGERESMNGSKQRLRLHKVLTIACIFISCWCAVTNVEMPWISHVTHTTMLSGIFHLDQISRKKREKGRGNV